MTNKISVTDFTTASEVLIQNNYEVDVIDLEQLDSIIAQQHEQDQQEDVEMTQDTVHTQVPGKNVNIYMYRIFDYAIKLTEDSRHLTRSL